jgi:hypothetical protein
MKIADCLGGNVSDFLAQRPFNDWPVERDDFAEIETSGYIFNGHHLELNCDNGGRILTIFAERGFDEKFLDIPFTFGRPQVLQRFGQPTRSGAPEVNARGECVPWDLFRLPAHAVHVEYEASGGTIRRITFMELDQVPEPIPEEIILAFIPSLLATLINREDAKGAPLTESEVLSIRDKAPVVAATKEQFKPVEEARGYKDLDAENAWKEWQSYREERRRNNGTASS